MKEKYLPSATFLKMRTAVMGGAILWIVLFHSGIEAPDSFVWRAIWYIVFSFGGGLGVNLFLFASGMGLMISAERRNLTGELQEPPSVFYKRRCMRILPAYFLVAGVYYILTSISIREFMLDFLLVSFWMNGTRDFWYVAAILVLYLLFPLYVSATRKYGHLFTLLVSLFVVTIAEISMVLFARVYFGQIEVFLLRIPVFCYGCFIGGLVCKRQDKTVLCFLKILIVLLIGSVLLNASNVVNIPGIMNRHMFSLFTPILYYIMVLVFAILPKTIRWIFEYMGKRSLEIYLVHVSLGTLFLHIGGHDMVSMTFYYVGSVVVAELVYQITNQRSVFCSKLNQRRKHE